MWRDHLRRDTAGDEKGERITLFPIFKSKVFFSAEKLNNCFIFFPDLSRIHPHLLLLEGGGGRGRMGGVPRYAHE